MTEAVRVERTHEYEWWVPGATGDRGYVKAEVSGTYSTIRVYGLTNVEKDPLDLFIPEIPALIKALESIMARIDADENEEPTDG